MLNTLFLVSNANCSVLHKRGRISLRKRPIPRMLSLNMMHAFRPVTLAGIAFWAMPCGLCLAAETISLYQEKWRDVG